jgi:hypothetical protein
LFPLRAGAFFAAGFWNDSPVVSVVTPLSLSAAAVSMIRDASL